jgi:hypothetical protein
MSHSLPLLLEKVLQRNSATACKSKENKFENVPIQTDRSGGLWFESFPQYLQTILAQDFVVINN